MSVCESIFSLRIRTSKSDTHIKSSRRYIAEVGEIQVDKLLKTLLGTRIHTTYDEQPKILEAQTTFSHVAQRIRSV
jgi:hypothetical protein